MNRRTSLFTSLVTVSALVGTSAGCGSGADVSDAGPISEDHDAAGSPSDGGALDAGTQLEDAGDARDSGPAASDAGGTDAGPADAGPAAPEALSAPPGTWTWVDFPDARCANGESTGLGVNLSDVNDGALIFLMGGGGCWDQATCYDSPQATNISGGFGATEFATLTAGLGDGLFDRENAENPFRDYSYILVPYCTGDSHAGDNAAPYGPDGVTHHVGYANMTAFLARIHATFTSADRIVLAGSSAGGYGAAYNWGRTQDLFGEVRVDLVNDCGPALPNPYMTEEFEAVLRSSWGLDRTLPSDCELCGTDLTAQLRYDLDRHTSSRVALLAYLDDPTVRIFHGDLTLARYQQALGAVRRETFNLYAQAATFFVDDSAHTMLEDPSTVSAGGTGLFTWLTDMVGDEAGWRDAP